MRTPPLHALGVVGREELVETGLGLVPGEDTVGPDDVAQALGVDLLQLGIPKASRHNVHTYMADCSYSNAPCSQAHTCDKNKNVPSCSLTKSDKSSRPARDMSANA
jgi:hypothetical protein